MNAPGPIRILVTGEHDDLDSRFPTELGHRGLPLEWVSVPVLNYERLPVDPELLKSLVESPPDWIIFTSQRGVKFWAELLLEAGVQFPIQTQVAAIGARTAEVANQEGFTPDFFPTEPGTEKFLEEFEDLLGNTSLKPTVLIPMAEGGRPTLREKLGDLGCKVNWVALYRSTPKENLDVSATEVETADMILFTSPSSVEAFTKHFPIPENVRIGSIGRFTSDYLSKRGIESNQLPNGDFERIGEILC
jgi:uroporphyrinogen-III synthase